jgi:glycosyltransferase involved in cell wall biosynthesis
MTVAVFPKLKRSIANSADTTVAKCTSVSLVIPAYNEENGIASVIERSLPLRDELAKQGMTFELVVVDDGSQDKTASIVAQYPSVNLVRHPHNRGYGAAIKTGFCKAAGDYLGFIDADGTYPPESLPALCRAAVEQNADIVIGSRMSGAHSEMPITRRIGNIVYATLLSLICNQVIHDTTSGMRLIRKSALARIYPLPDTLDFTPAMSTRAFHENLSVIEVPIPYAERLGRSKLNIVRDGVRFTNSIVWTALAYNPVRMLGMIGSVAMVIAMFIGAGVVAMRLSGVTELDPVGVFSLFAALVLAVCGIGTFALGATFNYLTSLFHKRPVRSGLFGKPLFKTSLDHHFGWIGLLCSLGGVVLGITSFLLGMNGWEITRLWFYLLASVSMILVGMQLTISWIVMRTLDQLAQREIAAQRDLGNTND